MHARTQLLRGSQLCRAWRTSLDGGCRPFTSAAPRRLDSTASETADTPSAGSAQAAADAAARVAAATAAEAAATAGQPRWAYTPHRMKAPFSLQQPKDPRRSIWVVNEDPEKLERMYEKLLGRDIARKLPDELKWLAVTHKSFDNGRRGFNTRLAFYGRMILALETTRAIMGSATQSQAADPYGRVPFEHVALANVDKLNDVQPHQFSSPAKMAALAREVGLPGVIRWKPRLPENLESSGITVVLTSTLFAIIGAVSLHHGADVASRVVGERILKRLSV